MPVHEVTIGHMLRPRLNIAPSDPIVFSPDDTCPEGDLTYIVKAQVILPYSVSSAQVSTPTPSSGIRDQIILPFLVQCDIIVVISASTCYSKLAK